MMIIKIPVTKIILLKGEKRIKVKATSKRKAHYRTIRGSDKSKKLELEQVLNVYEKSIRNQDFESCGTFDNSGNMIFNKDGEKDKIGFNEEERLKQKGMIFTHNHPIGYSFSPEDLKWACQAEMKEMRVISKSGEKFIMKMKDGSNFNMKLWDEKINLAQNTMNNQVHNDFINDINNNKMTIKEANDSHWDTVWRNVVKGISELKYDWVI